MNITFIIVYIVLVIVMVALQIPLGQALAKRFRFTNSGMFKAFIAAIIFELIGQSLIHFVMLPLIF